MNYSLTILKETPPDEGEMFFWGDRALVVESVAPGFDDVYHVLEDGKLKNQRPLKAWYVIATHVRKIDAFCEHCSEPIPYQTKEVRQSEGFGHFYCNLDCEEEDEDQWYE